MAESPPKYLFLVCGGRRCVPVMAVTDEAIAETQAIWLFGLLVAHLRRIGALGRLVLLDKSGRRIVTRRIWP
jgi:hypothetical protein